VIDEDKPRYHKIAFLYRYLMITVLKTSKGHNLKFKSILIVGMVAHLDEDALLGVADLQKGHHKTGFSLCRDNQEKWTFEGQIGKISQVIDVIRSVYGSKRRIRHIQAGTFQMDKRFNLPGKNVP